MPFLRQRYISQTQQARCCGHAMSPLLNTRVTLLRYAYATAFGRGCQVGSVVYRSVNISVCTSFSHYYYLVYNYTPCFLPTVTIPRISVIRKTFQTKTATSVVARVENRSRPGLYHGGSGGWSGVSYHIAFRAASQEVGARQGAAKARRSRLSFLRAKPLLEQFPLAF